MKTWTGQAALGHAAIQRFHKKQTEQEGGGGEASVMSGCVKFEDDKLQLMPSKQDRGCGMVRGCKEIWAAKRWGAAKRRLRGNNGKLQQSSQTRG